VDGIVRTLEGADPNPFNLGNPSEMPVLEFARRVNEAVGNVSGVRFETLPESRVGDPARRCPDIGRARTVLGWEPKVDLTAGLDLTVGWFRRELVS
jgi:nucleoside-diphosphate-sugar epimerase